jgi:hypothetical protein
MATRRGRSGARRRREIAIAATCRALLDIAETAIKVTLRDGSNSASGGTAAGRDLMADGDDGLTIVLSPVQLAAVLNDYPISEQETLTNRLWGGAKAVGGAIEVICAGFLLLAPEPTTATKFAGGVLGVHGLDTFQAGVREAATGQSTPALTQEAATALARTLGFDPDTADKVGVVVDIAVPIAVSLGLGAARILALRGGRVALAAEEAAGGHTIARHVARTEAQLRARLAAEQGIPAATTFKTLQEAERVVYEAMRANRAAIQQWAQAGGSGTKSFTFSAGRTIGQGVVRSTGQMQNMSNVNVVLRKVATAGRQSFVLTAYPKP